MALENDWTAAHGLPHAQPFPWDQSKGLYLLNGFQALHCLKNIPRAIREYELDMPQSLPLTHITHCLDSLRGDILCQADDMPQCTTRIKTLESGSRADGLLSLYQPQSGSINQFNLFKCPSDSSYWPELRQHFGKSEDWFGEG